MSCYTKNIQVLNKECNTLNFGVFFDRFSTLCQWRQQHHWQRQLLVQPCPGYCFAAASVSPMVVVSPFGNLSAQLKLSQAQACADHNKVSQIS